MAELTFAVVLDRDKEGALKKTKGGDYRFTLKLRDGEMELMSVEGFRLSEDMAQVEPPVVYGRYSSIRIIKMGKEFEERVLEGVKRILLREVGGG